jgi:hypothetical protein
MGSLCGVEHGLTCLFRGFSEDANVVRAGRLLHDRQGLGTWIESHVMRRPVNERESVINRSSSEPGRGFEGLPS